MAWETTRASACSMPWLVVVCLKRDSSDSYSVRTDWALRSSSESRIPARLLPARVPLDDATLPAIEPVR
ncbi:hypothetical protein D3C85_1823910 [compost metagenome]